MDLKFQLKRLNKNLNILRLREAKYGGNAPLELLNLIDDYVRAVSLTKATLDGQLTPEQLAAEMAPLNVIISLPFSGTTEVSFDHVQGQLIAFQLAQQYATDPRRFQAKIDELQATIAEWEDRFEQQQQRIADGLADMRYATAHSGRIQNRFLVVGQPPIGAVDCFVNRVQEQETIANLLHKPTTRLVSVIGHGGMGKTALACKILQELERHQWPYSNEKTPLDGIIYLSTRTSGISLERLFLDCARLLGGEQEDKLNAIWTNLRLSIDEKVSQLLDSLKEGRYVILLDNIEDLVDGQGAIVDEELQLFLDQTLIRGSGVQLLVTSRQALLLRREVMRFDWQVKLLEGLSVEDGVTLLRELDPNGDYGIREAPEDLLARAVSMVHGLPRALEVLTGILANDPFASLDEVLDSFYKEDDVIQDLIEENYKRLDVNTRRVIEALAVFRRPISPLAIDHLLEPFVRGLNTPRIIERLIRTNIVSVDRNAKTVALHPIDQDFSYKQLPGEGVDDEVYTRQALERRAADYYTQIHLPDDSWEAISDIESQIAEFEHRVRAGDYDNAALLINRIDENFLSRWGHYWRALDMRQQLLGKNIDNRLEEVNLGRIGVIHDILGQYTQAIDFHQQALSIAREAGDKRSEGIRLGHLGEAYRNLGKVKMGLDYYQQALKIAREIGDQQSEGVWLGELGEVYANLAQYERSFHYYEQGVVIARQVNNKRAEALYLGGRALNSFSLGEYAKGVSDTELALETAREIGDRQLEAEVLNDLAGDLYFRLGWYSQAIGPLKRSILIASEIGDKRTAAKSLGNLGRCFHDLGHYEQANKHYRQAVEIFHEIGAIMLEMGQLVNLAGLYADQGQYEQATDNCKQALETMLNIGDREGEGVLQVKLGAIYGDLGQYASAISCFDQGLKIAHEIKQRFLRGYHLSGLGKISLALRQYDDALDKLTEALAIAREIDNSNDLQDRGIILAQIYLCKGDFSLALDAIISARLHDVLIQNHRSSVLYGLLLTILDRKDEALAVFNEALIYAEELLAIAPDCYRAKFTQGLAFSGLALLNDNSIHNRHLDDAMDAYRAARANCDAPGVIKQHLRLLDELIKLDKTGSLAPLQSVLAIS